MSLPEPCSCPEPGWCVRYQRMHVGRLYEICKGTVLTPEKCARYRWQWDHAVGVLSDEPPKSLGPVISPWHVRQRDEGKPCRYRGEELRTEVCRPCGGRIQLKVFECAKFKECTVGKDMPGLACCKNCGSYQSQGDISPLWQKRVEGLSNEVAFNNSIILFGGKRLMAYRTAWAGSNIDLCELDGDYRPVWTKRLKLPICKYNNGGREDPRLFTFRGELYVSYIGVEVWGRGNTITNQMYAKLDSNLEVEWTTLPVYHERQFWEKNWGFFEHDRELYAVYSIMPHKVLHIAGDHATLAHETPNAMPWKCGVARGGAPPVLHNGEYYSWFHGAQDEHYRFYSIGLYTFENKAPFTPNCMLTEPLLMADTHERPAAHVPHCVFPGGAVLENNAWVVSYGYYDKWSHLIGFDVNEVAMGLTAIPGGPQYEVHGKTISRSKVEPVFNNEFYNVNGNYREWYAGYAKALEPKRVLEIGVLRGDSCIALLQGFPSIEHFELYDWEKEGPLSEAIANIRRHSQATITAHPGDTQQLAELGETGLFDLIHIDGDHTYPGCLHDLTLAAPHLAPGGLMVADDASTSPVSEAVKEFQRANQGWQSIFIPTTRGHRLLWRV